jgi:hypothetical protein
MANQTHQLLSRESRAAIRRDRERLLRPMVAGGVARLTLPGRI